MILMNKFKRLLLPILFFCFLNVCIAKPLESEKENKTSDNEIENQVQINDENIDYRALYAKQMLTYMNQSVDPCDDFYEYACGNWKNVIKERRINHKRNNLIDISYKLSEAMEELIEGKLKSSSYEYESEFLLAQQFYQSCLAADLKSFKKSSEYFDVINSIGGFPAVDDTWNPETFNWFNMSAHLTNYGASGLINEKILPQYPFPPYFKFPELGFGFIVHSDNINSNSSSGYTFNARQMRKYLSSFGVEEIKIEEVIFQIFEFWKDVLKLSEQFDDDPAKCKEFDEAIFIKNFTEWDNLFHISWMGKNFDLTEDDCPCNFYYVELDQICKIHKHAVANYLAMAFLFRMDAGIESENDQKEYCMERMLHMASYLMDKLYLEEYFSVDIRHEVTSIVEEIRKSVRTTLEEADWLDETTRTEALLKESTLVSRVGRYEDTELSDKLIREMNNLKLEDNNYEKNNLNVYKFKAYMTRYLGLYSEVFDNNTRPLELIIGAQVNAFYYNIDNSINVMAGILHPPAYHKEWPISLKYGTLGYLVGHEFTHGFDSVGSGFDSNGDERYWWSKKAGTVFDDRANCFVNYFDSYLIPEINRYIDGNNTKDENIADSGGLREALNAYRGLMKKLSKEQDDLLEKEQLPELKLSPEQLFFLGFGQLWCASYKEEHLWEELNNEHTIDKYRVIGTVSNFEEFSKAYNCPLGTKMNSQEEKCRVW